jgi:hypothetical protein
MFDEKNLDPGLVSERHHQVLKLQHFMLSSIRGTPEKTISRRLWTQP